MLWLVKTFRAEIPNWVETRGERVQRRFLMRLLGVCHACPAMCSYGAEVKEGKYAGVKVSRALHGGLVTDFGAKCAIDNIPTIWNASNIEGNITRLPKKSCLPLKKRHSGELLSLNSP